MTFEKQSKLDKEFFERKGSKVAEDLMGKLLLNEDNGAAGIIVETEAYIGSKDPSCHYDGKPTARGKVFEKGPGTVYIYKIHGHDCINFICGSEKYPEGVLIRALKPVESVEDMKKRRGFEDEKKLCSGPGKLTEALGITKDRHNGENLENSGLSLYETDYSREVLTGSRIGISSAEKWPLRYVDSGSSFVSKSLKQPENSFRSERFYSEVDR